MAEPEVRTVHFKLDPALRAYFAWLDETGRTFSPNVYDLFAAGYRARVTEEAARQQPGREVSE